MARQNTQLESAGAEFLVLGNLLIECIPAFKSYTNMKGYDLVAVNAEKNLSARIQVKSRWRSKAEGFIINNFESFFYMRSGQWVFSVFMGAIYSTALHWELNRLGKEGHENLRH